MPFKPTFSFKKLRNRITDLDSKAVTAYRFRTLKGYLDDLARIDFDQVLRDAENVECFAGWDLSSVWRVLPNQRLQSFLTILEMKMNVTKGGEQDAIWQSFLRILYAYCPDAAFGIALESESRGRRYQELVNKGLNKKEIGQPCNFKHVAGSKLQQTSSCLDLTSRGQDAQRASALRPTLRHQDSSSIDENPYAEPHDVTPARSGTRRRSCDLNRMSLPPPPALPAHSLDVPSASSNGPLTTPSPLPSPPPPPMGYDDSLPAPPTPPSARDLDDMMEDRFTFAPIDNTDPGHYRSYTPLPSPPPNPDQDTPIYGHSHDLQNGNLMESMSLYVPPPPTEFMSDFYGNFADATFIGEVDQVTMGSGTRNQNSGDVPDPRATFAPLAKPEELSTRL